MNPLDRFIEAKGTREKTASMKDKVRSSFNSAVNELPGQVIGATALGVAGAAVAGAAVGVHHLYNAATKTRDFKSMLSQNEFLASHDNPKMVNQAFTTLRRFAPEFSKDPLVAGTYVQRMVESPIGAAGIIGDAMSSHGRMTSRISDVAQAGAISGLKFKDPKELMMKDMNHQKALEQMRHGFRSQEAAEDRTHRSNMEMGKAWQAQGFHKDRMDQTDRHHDEQVEGRREQHLNATDLEERKARFQAALRHLGGQHGDQVEPLSRVMGHQF
jgi:hypothetical protein